MIYAAAKTRYTLLSKMREILITNRTARHETDLSLIFRIPRGLSLASLSVENSTYIQQTIACDLHTQHYYVIRSSACAICLPILFVDLYILNIQNFPKDTKKQKFYIVFVNNGITSSGLLIYLIQIANATIFAGGFFIESLNKRDIYLHYMIKRDISKERKIICKSKYVM